MSRGASPVSGGPVTLRIQPGWLVGLTLVPLVAGLVLGAIASPAHHWLEDRIGFSGPFSLLDRLPTYGAIGLLGVAGLLIGLMMAGDTRDNSGVLVIDSDHLEVGEGEPDRWIPQRAIRSVVVERDHLTIFGDRSQVLAAVDVEALSQSRLKDELVQRGYPWRDGGDPFAADYRPWLAGTPDLDVAGHDLMRRRAALEGQDLVQVDAQLLDLGVVARTADSGRQEWRPARRL